MKDAVLGGGLPFNKAFGMNIYDYSGTDPRFNMVFNQAMKDHSTIIMNKILENYTGFEGLTSLVDVGGCTGASLDAIISKYPTIKGINFDLPHVVNDALSNNNGNKICIKLLKKKVQLYYASYKEYISIEFTVHV